MEAQGIWEQPRRGNIDSNMGIPNIESAGCGLSSFLAEIAEMCRKFGLFVKNLDFRHPPNVDKWKNRWDIRILRRLKCRIPMLSCNSVNFHFLTPVLAEQLPGRECFAPFRESKT